MAGKVRPFIVASIRKQIEFGVNTEACYCLGEGKNFAFLEKLNSEYGFFQNLVPLPHPRFIMQYKRKKLKSYLQLYKDKLTSSFK
ncbi:MAG: DUF4918 family protein [Flammeovirgaceae bacterium]|nr:DUF4918 family protein [Flammeovirgaceae bacterium]